MALQRLDGLAVQARMFSAGAAMNLLQLGRVLCEAKELVRHGEWAEWVRINAHLPMRTAQQYMQAYTKFGIDPEISKLGAGHIIRLLPMSDEEREELLRDNDVESMTDRELKAAIREQRERLRGEVIEDVRQEVAGEIQAEADREMAEIIRQRDEAREALREAEARGSESDPALISELETARENWEHFAQMAKEAQNQRAAALKDYNRLQADYDEQRGLLEDQQRMINDQQEEIFNLKSAQARGDTQRAGGGDELTAEAFNDAVRDFVGLTARMPYMQTTFAGMTTKEKRGYVEGLRVIEGWLEGARAALMATAVEGVVVNG